MAKSRRKLQAERRDRKEASNFFKILIAGTLVLLILLYFYFAS